MNSVLIIALVALNLLPNFGFAQTTSSASNQDRTLLKGVSNREFNKPLYFDQIDQGVLLPPMQIDYEVLTAPQGALRMGPVVISEENFKVEIVHKEKLTPTQQDIFPNLDLKSQMLLFSWPQHFISPQTLEVISASGRTLWEQPVNKNDLNSWQTLTRTLQSSRPFKGTQLGLQNWQRPELLKTQGAFRFCFTNQGEDERTRLCTGHFRLQRQGDLDQLTPVSANAKGVRVLVNNVVAPLKGSVAVPADDKLVFYAELSKGEFIEVLARSPKFELMDIVETSKESRLRVVGSGVRPLQKTLLLNEEEYNALTRLIGFEDTIRDSRVIWVASLNEAQPRMHFPGLTGALFTQKFELSQIPSYRNRVYLHHRAPIATYDSEVSLRSRKPADALVNSTENSIEIEKAEDRDFIWNFNSQKKGQINRSYLTVQAGDQSYKSYYEIYRGYSTEISARLSAVQSVSFIFMGELALNHWFEDILGWDQYYISRHRWGLGAKYFQAFNDIKVNNTTNSITLSALTVDLRYRLAPGLWGRDETLGLIGSYQDVSFGQLKAPMAGGGVFWARSMPRSLDQIFNIVPGMNYPKWVDVEFIFYTSPMSSDIRLNSSMALNFHGKVLWSESIFGEAGFGMKRYGFQDIKSNQQAELNTFYGTVGLGLSF